MAFLTTWLRSRARRARRPHHRGVMPSPITMSPRRDGRLAIALRSREVIRGRWRGSRPHAAWCAQDGRTPARAIPEPPTRRRHERLPCAGMPASPRGSGRTGIIGEHREDFWLLEGQVAEGRHGAGTDGAFRLMVTGGGSGGHTYPALATVRALRSRLAAAGRELVVVWAGTAGSLEQRVAGGELIPFRAIATGKLRRAGNPLLMLTPRMPGTWRGCRSVSFRRAARCGSSGLTRCWRPEVTSRSVGLAARGAASPWWSTSRRPGSVSPTGCWPGARRSWRCRRNRR